MIEKEKSGMTDAALAAALREAGEYYAAGLFETPERSLFYRKSLALRRYYENCPLQEYTGTLLYPSGVYKEQAAVRPNYWRGLWTDTKRLEALVPGAAERITAEFDSWVSSVPPEHTVAGNMYVHSIPDWARICAEGFDGYAERIGRIGDTEMREGLTEVLAGLRTYGERCAAYLRSVRAPEELVRSVERVPFRPAESFYDAVECCNWITYLDNCDNLGALSVGLLPWYRGEENVIALLENLYDNLDANNGYSMSLGTEVNALTVPCLLAAKGKRRPMIELFADDETPAEVWDAAVACVLSGGGQPAFYNRKLYLEGFLRRFPRMDPENAKLLCGGGCTEMMVSGRSNVGSLDAGVNLLLLLERSMRRDLAGCAGFEEFYRKFMDAAHAETLRILETIAESQKTRSERVPLPMRSLLVRGCIEKGLDYNHGGAECMWSVVNFAGIINVIDSLLALRETVFEKKEMTAEEFLKKLAENDEAFLERMKRSCLHFGTDDARANEFSAAFSEEVFGWVNERNTYFGWGFLASSIQFMSYAGAGEHVGATPCGRGAGEPLCDSLTAVFNKDTQGPTALLRSVTSLKLSAALGTPVVNLTVNSNCDANVLKGLIQSYLELGGMQLQITCMSRETLEKAYADPEAYPNLVVRVGGYSEYFVRLDDVLRRKVLERSYHL